MKNQFYNNGGNPPQMNMQNLQKQTQQQKIAFTEAQILEQAKRSLESNYQQMAFNQQFNGDPKMMQHLGASSNFHINNSQPQKFPPADFEMNSALKQLRDIADARSNIPNPFPGMNPNPFNNGFNKSNHYSR